MIIKYKSSDCPDANGRQPNFGELRWTLAFPLENGDKLEVEIGLKGHKALLHMLGQEKTDDLKDLEHYRKLCEEHLDKTKDGHFVVECEKLYCPECGGEVEQQYHICYCWNCGNPDSYDEIPLPLSYTSCFAKPKAP